MTIVNKSRIAPYSKILVLIYLQDQSRESSIEEPANSRHKYQIAWLKAAVSTSLIVPAYPDLVVIQKRGTTQNINLELFKQSFQLPENLDFLSIVPDFTAVFIIHEYEARTLKKRLLT